MSVSDLPHDSIAAPAASAGPRTRARLLVLTLVTAATLINYLDRSILGVAAPFMSKELGIDAAVMGVVFSAFSWSYAAAQIPGGVFLDRFGSRLTYFLSLTGWSLVTLVQGLATGLGFILGCRLALGVAEAPCFPTNSRVISTWFPQHERARATGVYSVGEYFGLAFLSPLLFWVSSQLGWRALFLGVGVIGIAFGFIWWVLYREPQDSKQANAAELAYIEAGGGIAPGQKSLQFSWQALRQLLGSRQILGASIGQFAGNSTLVFFLTWFPTYLAVERHMAWLKAGIFAVLPFIAASFGVFTGGYLSDLLLKRTGSANLARKLPMIVGLSLTACIVLANFVQDDRVVIAIMSVAFFGQGLVGLGWAIITDVAPVRQLGLAAGVFNLATNFAGIITPTVIGVIVATTGSFVWALAMMTGVALIGVFSYVVIMGDVKRVEIT